MSDGATFCKVIRLVGGDVTLRQTQGKGKIRREEKERPQQHPWKESLR